MSRNLYDSTNDTLTPLGGYQSIDSELSATSGNPLMNRVVTAALDKKFGSEDAAENSIATNDYIPFYDTSEGENKKIEVSKLNLGGGGSTITVTTTSAELFGKTVTLSKGTTTLSSAFNSQGEAVFAGVMMTGVLTVECEGNATTVDVTFFGNYEVALLAGFDYEAWLEAGGVTGSYSSLDDVLADEVALRRLFTVHASVDYMADIRDENEDVEKIINNDLAAKWINLRDYALDTLYANTYIAAYMDTADKYFYGEWVITDNTTTPPTWGAKGNVPVMTANNAPYGEASASSVSSGYDAWRAFMQEDDGEYDRWVSVFNVTNAYIQYKFVNPTCVKKVSFKSRALSRKTGDTALDATAIIQASNDGFVNDTHDLATISITAADADNVVDYDVSSNDNYYLYYRIQFNSANIRYDNHGYCGLALLQFYGRELSVSVPTMTGNAAPYGEASVNKTIYGSGYAYKAFNNDSTGSGSCTLVYNASMSDGRVHYKFTSAKKILMAVYKTFSTSDNSRVKSARIVYSDDGTTWENASEVITFSASQTVIPINISEPHLYWGIGNIINGGNTGNVFVSELQFYGLDYSEKEFEEGVTKKWLYDHGVELETLSDVTGSTATYNHGPSSILEKQTNSSQGAAVYAELDLTPYDLMRVKISQRFVGSGNKIRVLNTAQTSVIANATISDLPYNTGLDISTCDGTYAIDVLALGVSEIEFNEWWLE